ncbi:MAG: PAS domain-containing protein [Pseudomonadota bacterium]
MGEPDRPQQPPSPPSAGDALEDEANVGPTRRDGHYLERELQALLSSDPDALSFLTDHALDGAWYWDLQDPDVEWMSDGFWRTIGHDPSAKTHRASEWRDLIDPDDLRVALDNFNAHLADPNHPYDQIVRYRRADGGVTAVRCRGVAIRDDAGRPVRMLGTHTDVTRLLELIELEERLEADRAKALFRVAMSSASSAIFGLDGDRRVIVANPRALELLGWREDDLPRAWPAPRGAPLPGVSIVECAAPPDCPIVPHVVEPDHAPEGDRFYRFSCTEPRTQAGGEPPPVAWIVTLDDVTEELQARRQAEKLRRMDAVGRLASGVAHDFNNILAAILPSVQVALLRSTDPKTCQALENAIGAARKGAVLSQHLLSFAQDGSETPLEPVSVAPALAAFHALADATLGADTPLTLEPVDPSLTVHCDREALDHVLLNLVINSRDAIRSAGRRGAIRLGAEPATCPDGAAGVDIWVSDDGPGMTAEVRDNATEPFFSTKQAEGGTGLGLASAEVFVKRSGGAVSIGSSPSGGARVALTLPIAPRADAPATPLAPALPDDPPAQLASDKGAASPTVSQNPRRRVLVVDDQPEVGRALMEAAAMLGHQARAARDIASAMEALAELHAEDAEDTPLLLADIALAGGESGLDLATRAQRAHPALRVVFVTGKPTPQTLAQGAIVLLKPVGLAELSAAVRAAFDVDVDAEVAGAPPADF